jgi:hypothetical protein
MMSLTYPQRGEILYEQEDGGLRSIQVNQDENLARALYKQKAIKAAKVHNTWGLEGPEGHFIVASLHVYLCAK